MITVTRADIVEATRQYTDYWWRCKVDPIIAHCSIQRAIIKAVREETGIQNVTVYLDGHRPNRMPKSYVVYANRFVTKIPITWHIRRQMTFSFVIQGLPARVKKNG